MPPACRAIPYRSRGGTGRHPRSRRDARGAPAVWRHERPVCGRGRRPVHQHHRAGVRNRRDRPQPGQSILLGFNDPASLGDGFDSLHFQVFRGRRQRGDLTFTDLLAATAYFTGTTISISDWSQGLTGDLDILLRLDHTSSKAGDGFWRQRLRRCPSAPCRRRRQCGCSRHRSWAGHGPAGEAAAKCRYFGFGKSLT